MPSDNSNRGEGDNNRSFSDRRAPRDQNNRGFGDRPRREPREGSEVTNQFHQYRKGREAPNSGPSGRSGPPSGGRPERSGGGFGREDRSDRPRRDGGSGGFNREGRPGGGFRRDDRSDRPRRDGDSGGFKREGRPGGGFGRDDRSDRPRRDGGSGGFNREGRPGGGFRRDDRSDRPRRDGDSGGFKREGRPGGGFGRDDRSDRPRRDGGSGGFNREGRPGGGFRRDDRSDRPRRDGDSGGFKREGRPGGGFGRDDRNDRPRRDGGSGGFNREGRPGGGFRRDDRPRRDGDSGGFNREGRPGGGFRRDDRPRRDGDSGGFNREGRPGGGFRRDDRSDRPRRDGGSGGFNREGRPGGGFRRDDRRDGGFSGGRGRSDFRRDGGSGHSKPEFGGVRKKVIQGPYVPTQAAKSPSASPRPSKTSSEDDLQPVRVQKLISNWGYGSRRLVEEWVETGRLTINGKVATLGDKASGQDVILLDGNQLTGRDKPKLEVLLYHKPIGEESSANPSDERPSVFDALPPAKEGRWVQIGRLDVNTTGLMIFVNQGDIAQIYSHPKYEMDREYMVRLAGKLEPSQKQRLLDGVMLEDGLGAFSDIVKGPETNESAVNRWYCVTIQEGRNRIVRRLFEAIGYQVSRLVRVRHGSLILPRDLALGKFRYLEDNQIEDWLKELEQVKANAENQQTEQSAVAEEE